MHVLHTIKYLNKRNQHSTCHHVRRQQVEFSNILVHVSAGLRLKVAARNIIGTKQHFLLRVAYVYTWDIISPC